MKQGLNYILAKQNTSCLNATRNLIGISKPLQYQIKYEAPLPPAEPSLSS